MKSDKDKLEKIKLILDDHYALWSNSKGLLASKIRNIIDEPEKPQFRKGQLVEVWNHEDNKKLKIFSSKDETDLLSFVTLGSRTSGEENIKLTWKFCRQPSWEILARTWAPEKVTYATIDKKGTLSWWENKPIKYDKGTAWFEGGAVKIYINIKQYLPENFDWEKAIIEL